MRVWITGVCAASILITKLWVSLYVTMVTVIYKQRINLERWLNWLELPVRYTFWTHTFQPIGMGYSDRPRYNRYLLWIRSNPYITLLTQNWFSLSSFVLFFFVPPPVHWQKKQDSKAPDKDAILKATANLSTRHSDRTVTQHNIRDVSEMC